MEPGSVLAWPHRVKAQEALDGVAVRRRQRVALAGSSSYLTLAYEVSLLPARPPTTDARLIAFPPQCLIGLSSTTRCLCVFPTLEANRARPAPAHRRVLGLPLASRPGRVGLGRGRGGAVRQGPEAGPGPRRGYRADPAQN